MVDPVVDSVLVVVEKSVSNVVVETRELSVEVVTSWLVDGLVIPRVICLVVSVLVGLRVVEGEGPTPKLVKKLTIH